MRKLKWYEIMVCVIAQISTQVGVFQVSGNAWLALGIALPIYYLMMFVISKAIR